MKKLLILIAFILFPILSHADTKTSGNIGLIKVSTGSIDKTRHWGDKYNENFDMIAATFTTNIANITSLNNTLYGATIYIQNGTSLQSASFNITSGSISGFSAYGSTAQANTGNFNEILVSTINGRSPLSLNTAQELTLRTGGSTRLFVASGGNIGIGTNAPLTLLDISGGSLTVRGTNAGIVIGTSPVLTSSITLVLYESTQTKTGNLTIKGDITAGKGIFDYVTGNGSLLTNLPSSVSPSTSGIAFGIYFSTVGASTNTLTVQIATIDIQGTQVSIATTVALYQTNAGGLYPATGASKASIMTAFACWSDSLSTATVILSSGNLTTLVQFPPGFNKCSKIPYGVFRLDSGGVFAPFEQKDDMVTPYNVVHLLSASSTSNNVYQSFPTDSFAPPTIKLLEMSVYHTQNSISLLRFNAETYRANRSSDLNSDPDTQFAMIPAATGNMEQGARAWLGLGSDGKIKIRTIGNSSNVYVSAFSYMVTR